MIKKLGRIARAFGYILVAAMAAFTAFVIISNAKGEIAFIGGKTMVWVLTPSMEPTIPGKSYILVERITADEVRVGDVIVYRSDDPAIAGRYNTHRVVEIIGNGEEFVTKGDNNLVPDNYNARAECVTGRYIRNMPVMSGFGRFLASGMGIAMTLTVIVAFFAAICLPSLVKSAEDKGKKAEEDKQKLIDELVKAEVERLKAQDEAAAPEKENNSERE